MVLIWVLAACSLVYWLAMLGLVERVIAAVPSLRDLQPPPPKQWPRVSVIVPARNEASTLVPALCSKLQIRYRNLEIILVDDRSNDATPLLARAIARHHEVLRVVRVDALPEGWLGKVHAMHRGVEQASGSWLLFCDADVHLAPGALAKVIAYAEHERLDHVTMLPKITATEGPLVATLTTFLRQLCVAGRLWSVADPRSTASVGIGAFNLVRRTALERAGGLPALKMALDDDLALGRMLKRSGARQKLLNARPEVMLEFYPSFVALTRALEKNGAAAPCALGLLGLALLVALECGLLVGLASGSPLACITGLVAWLCASLATLRFAVWIGLETWPAFVPFAGALPLAWAIGRAFVLAEVRGGVSWRGTFYPKNALAPTVPVSVPPTPPEDPMRALPKLAARWSATSASRSSTRACRRT